MPHYDTKKYAGNDNAARAAADDLQRDYPGQATAVIWTSPNVGYLHDQDDQFTSKDHFEVPNPVAGTTGYDALVMDTKKKSFTVEFYADRAKYTALCGDFIEKKIGDKLLRYEFPAVHVRTWQQAYLPVIGDLPLKHVCMPKTHDSGMYKLVDTTLPGGRRSTCLNHSCSIYDQLQLGARWFDIRPFFWKGKWAFGHFSPINKDDLQTGIPWVDEILKSGNPLVDDILQNVLGWQGATGASIEEIIDDFNRFSSTTQELIVVEISHITNLDNEGKVTDADKRSILGLLSKIQNRYHAPDPKNVKLGDESLRHYISGRSSVLVLFSPDGNYTEFTEDDINPFDFYNRERLDVIHEAFGKVPTNEEVHNAIIYDLVTNNDEKMNPYSIYNLSKNQQKDMMPDQVKRLWDRALVGHLEMNYLENVDNLGICLAATLNRVKGKERETIIVYGGSVITSPEIKAKVEAAIAAKSNYLVSNDTLGGDPWCGTSKSCVVFWYVDIDRKQNARFAWEGQVLDFSD